MNDKNRTWIAFLGVLLTWWVVGAYFLKVPPGWDRMMVAWREGFTSDQVFLVRVFLRNLLLFLGFVFSAIAVGTVYFGTGRRASKSLGLIKAPLPVVFVVGAVFYGLLFLGLGLCGLWFHPILLAFLGGGFLTAVWDAWRGRERGAFYPAGGGLVKLVPGDGKLRFALAVSMLLPLLALGFGFLPEIFYDSQVYHLAVPEQWALRHAICDLPWKIFSYFPFLGELMSLPAGWLSGWGSDPSSGAEAPKLLGGLAWVMTAFLARRWADEMAALSGEPPVISAEGSERIGQTAGWIAFCAVVSCPLFCMTSWTVQVEGFLALLGLSFLYAVDRATDPGTEGKRGWAAAAGLFFGGAMAVKYNAVLLAAFLPVLLLQRKERRATVGLLSAAILPAALALPWALKNWVFVGNPAYPYLSKWFGGRLPQPEGFRQMLQEQRLWSVDHPLDWLTLPWRMFTDSPDGYNFLGPVTIVSILWLFWTPKRSKSARFLAFGFLLAFGVSLGVTHLPRFDAPLFPALFTVAAVAAASTPFIRRSAPLVLGLSALGCLPILLGMVFIHYSPQGMWTGREDARTYRIRAGVTPYQSLVDRVDALCGSGERVLLEGDARTLGYGREMAAGSVFDEPVLVEAARRENDVEGIARRLRRLGLDAVAINIQEGLRVGGTYRWWDLTAVEWKRLQDFFDRYGDFAGATGTAQVFRLRREAAAPTPTATRPILGLLFLDPGACDYIQAIRNGKADERDKALADLQSRQPFTPQWGAEQAVWWAQEGRWADAAGAWKKAASVGPLPRAHYAAWADAAKKVGRPREAAEALRQERKWYPPSQ